ncbi:hypothetical protein B0H10DRAFT_2065766 [Mycena sp. CBHHK59/15]|nr:hypothetical protein B0H10DRAFT_2065766 [Mycena sp. CBHHK59/15]
MPRTSSKKMSTSNAPDLPLELEREIFEMAAKADVRTALRLAVVARRVQTWIEPIIYSRVVVSRRPDLPSGALAPVTSGSMSASRRLALSRAQRSPRKATPVQPPRFIRTLPLRPAAFFARHVKRLHVGNLSEQDLVAVLSACTGISELGWWMTKCNWDADVVKLLGSLPLQRLSIDYTFSLDNLGIRSAPIFRTVTHLDMTFEDHYLPPRVGPLEAFTALTHVSNTFGRATPANVVSWCDDIIKGCPRLRILLILSDGIYLDQVAGFRPRHADPRVVVMLPPVRDWTSRWVHDSWPLAEDVFQERKKLAAAEKAAEAAAVGSEL